MRSVSPFGTASAFATSQHLSFGSNTISLNLEDFRGFMGSQTSVLNVVDTTPPTLSVHLKTLEASGVVVADATKLRTATGWEPRYALRQTLRDTLDYWRDSVSRES